jgi:hypothetical protein
MPEIELQRMDWSLAAKVGAGATAAATSATTTPAALFVLEIQGRLPPVMAKDQRAMVELLDRFAARLQRDGVSAELTKRPIDVESAKSFKSQRGEELDTAPQFTLRLGKPVAS